MTLDNFTNEKCQHVHKNPGSHKTPTILSYKIFLSYYTQKSLDCLVSKEQDSGYITERCIVMLRMKYLSIQAFLYAMLNALEICVLVYLFLYLAT